MFTEVAANKAFLEENLASDSDSHFESVNDSESSNYSNSRPDKIDNNNLISLKASKTSTQMPKR